MYKNRSRHATPKLNPKGHPKFFIPRSDIAFEKRVRYIESVCQVLIESRFGPGRVEPVVINFSDRPELDTAVFFDLCEGEPNGWIPCCALSPLGRTETNDGNASVNERALRLGTHNSSSALPPNQGRGSP